MISDYRTEADLRALLGESESMSLEFKGSVDFDAWPENREKIKDDLSKQVSAFANSYGGQILLGVKESKNPPRKAEAIVGLDPNSPPVETLQRMIDGNVRPRVDGLRVTSIRLSGANEGRVVYVIVVPQGKTAHQASDRRYYGRGEFESTPLEDQMVRHLMLRDRVAEAQIEVHRVTVEAAAEEYKARQIRLAQLEESARAGPFEDRFRISRQISTIREELAAPPASVDRYLVGLAIRNTGTRTIADCLLRVEFRTPFPVERAGSGPGTTWALRLAAATRVSSTEYHGTRVDSVDTAKVFPDETQPFPGADFILSVPAGTSSVPARLVWILYLEDSPTQSGEIDIGERLGTVAKA